MDDCFLFLGKPYLWKEFSGLLPRVILAHVPDARFLRCCHMVSPSSVTDRITQCFSCLFQLNTYQNLNSLFSAMFRAACSFPGLCHHLGFYKARRRSKYSSPIFPKCHVEELKNGGNVQDMGQWSMFFWRLV